MPENEVMVAMQSIGNIAWVFYRYLLGDVNADGVINQTDANMILQASVGSITLTSAQQKRADVNFDGVVNTADSLKVNQYIGGVINTFF